VFRKYDNSHNKFLFSYTGEEVATGWRKLLNEELCAIVTYKYCCV